METTNNQNWQTLKQKRNNRSPETVQERNLFICETKNRFDKLSIEEDTALDYTNNATRNKDGKPRDHKPPPVFIYGVNNYKQMTLYLSTAVDKEEYYCKSLTNGTITV